MSMTDASTTTGANGIGDEYDATKGIAVDMGYHISTGRFVGRISLITVYCTNVSAAPNPTSLTIKISRDQNGDEYVVTSTAGQIEAGETTSTKATAIYQVDAIVSLDDLDTVHLFAKTNHGTLDISEVRITWDRGE